MLITGVAGTNTFFPLSWKQGLYQFEGEMKDSFHRIQDLSGNH